MNNVSSINLRMPLVDLMQKLRRTCENGASA
ncbi:hypothetical protein HDG38_000825 [Paraburkholderia sp. WSM4177]|nr:hypothetical protein [Paraburkholderia sp. WSM4177]MBB5482962.1 hypothetical protein [Paraburkholderia sp. WSM4180]